MDNPDLSTSEAFSAFLEELRLQIQTSVKSVCHAKVDAIVMGMSAETFWGGIEGAVEFGVTTGAAACKAVMKTYGVKRIGIITPYQPVGDQQVTDYFTQIGCDIAALEGLKCPSATSIADVTSEERSRLRFEKWIVRMWSCSFKLGRICVLVLLVRNWRKSLGSRLLLLTPQLFGMRIERMGSRIRSRVGDHCWRSISQIRTSSLQIPVYISQTNGSYNSVCKFQDS
jgi:hypothetical protein